MYMYMYLTVDAGCSVQLTVQRMLFIERIVLCGLYRSLLSV